MLLIEKLARALTESRALQLNLPVGVVDIWARLPRDIRLNALKDALAVMKVMDGAMPDEMSPLASAIWITAAVSAGETHLKELSA